MTATIPLTLKMPDGRVLAFGIEARKAPHAWFALGVRKSGSSVFSSIVSALARFNDINVVDIPGAMFDRGYRWTVWNACPRLSDVIWRGNAYIGFRDAPTSLYGDPVFQQARKILMVRDPRDALVSEYFSNAYSHSLPTDGLDTSVVERERGRALESGCEEYVLKRVQYLNRTIAGYRALIGTPPVKIMRYEDVIFDKPTWIRDIAAYFGWRVSDRLVDNIIGWADLRPDAENPHAFVRRVAPGDYLDKLSADAIAQVNEQLSDIWTDLGYDIGR